MNIATFNRVVKYLKPTQSAKGHIRPPAVMIRGRHGIGKSAIIKSLAKNVLNMKLVDRRLGQMTEGDLIGLAKIDSDVTKFIPVDFIKRACEEGLVLFFDEANRATREVLQVMFQIVLDYELNGMVLHPDTRIFVAVNDGAEYQVTRMDPALKDRFFIVDLEPTVEDWLQWARSPEGNIDELIVNFIVNHPEYLEVEKELDPRKVYASRRSWEHLSNAFKLLMAEQDYDPTVDSWHMMLRHLSTGFVGVEVAANFADYVKTNGVRITAEIILTDSDRSQKMIRSMTHERWNFTSSLVLAWLAKNQLDEARAKCCGDFMKMLPPENRLAFWTQISQQSGVDNPIVIHNIKAIHEHIRVPLLEAINSSTKVEENKK